LTMDEKERHSRTAMLIGDSGVGRLKNSGVAVFGLGGVGGMACEALARAGVGRFLLVDADTVSESNINRQVIATYDTVGRYKTDVMEERILSVNPSAQIVKKQLFYDSSTADEISLEGYDCVLDAIDSVPSKLLLIETAYRSAIGTVSCMGAGNKLDPTRFEAADIYETSVCPLARVMRSQLRKRGVSSLRVIYSKEEPVRPREGGSVPGSAPWCAPAAGLAAAGEVIKILLREENK